MHNLYVSVTLNLLAIFQILTVQSSGMSECYYLSCCLVIFMFSFTVLAVCKTQQYSSQRENLLCFLFAAIYESVTGLSALLAASPFYLRQLGMLTSKNNQQGSVDHTEASLLLLVALQTLPKLPYYLAADQWRLEVLNSNLTNVTELNESWRRYRSVNNMHRVREIGAQLYSFLTLALKGGGSSQHYVNSHFTLRRALVPTAKEAGWATGPAWKVLPPGFEP